MIILRQSNYSIKDFFKSIREPAAVGALAGAGLLNPITLGKLDKYNLKLMGFSTLIGAGLGSMIGIVNYIKDKKKGAYTNNKSNNLLVNDIIVNEPGTLQELLKKYPKLKDLNTFIKNRDSLTSFSYDLDDYGILKDFEGFECDFFEPFEDKFDSTYYNTKKLRAELKSDDWISVLGSGDVAYNTKQNCYYLIDLYSNKKIVKQITINDYKKELLAVVNNCINNENYRVYQYSDDQIKKFNRKILVPLKQILK